jgi:heme-degrading monooxygenase HmoA
LTGPIAVRISPGPVTADRIGFVVRATLYMKVKDGRGDDFEREWRAIADKVRSVPGNVRQALARDPEDPDSFVVTSDWSTREEFGRFERSPEQDELTAPLRDLRASARMTVHELVVHIEREAG